jgi:glycosyltransferase involved in cell wall biosynthesis
MKNSTIAVFLNLGESFASLGSQAELMISQNITAFAKAFKRVYVFTYNQESVKLPPNCILITPPRPLHRYLYALLLPFIHGRIIRQCQVLRCFQLTGTVPAIIAKLFYGSKFVFNYGYDYAAFARIEGKPLQAQLFSWLTPVTVKFATGIIVKNKSLLQATRHAPRAIYLPNSVDIKLFRPKAKQLSQIPTILYVGRLEPQKNLVSLLTAISKLKRKVKIIFVGQGSQRQKLLDQARRLKLNLVIKTPVAHSRLPAIYQAADIFVLPSLIEGSPKVLLEAMACGLPIVATRVTDIKAGILVASTVTGLASGINRILSDPWLARRLGVAARRKAVKHYNQDNIIATEINYLKTCIR